MVDDLLAELERSPRHRLADLPTCGLEPRTGIYALWYGHDLLYVGVSRQDPATTTNPQARGVPGRLNTYRLARLGNDFTLAVAFRFVVPHLTASVSGDRLRNDITSGDATALSKSVSAPRWPRRRAGWWMARAASGRSASSLETCQSACALASQARVPLVRRARAAPCTTSWPDSPGSTARCAARSQRTGDLAAQARQRPRTRPSPHTAGADQRAPGRCVHRHRSMAAASYNCPRVKVTSALHDQPLVAWWAASGTIVSRRSAPIGGSRCRRS